MSKDRKQKQKHREQQRAKSQENRFKEFDLAMHRVSDGVSAAFDALSPHSKKLVRTWITPAPEILFDASVTDERQANEIRRQFQEILKRAHSDSESRLSYREWFCFVTPVAENLNLLVEIEEKDPQLSKEAFWPELLKLEQELRLCADQSAKVWKAALLRLLVLLFNHSRFDESIWGFRVETEVTKRCKNISHVHLHTTKPAKCMIAVEGKPRPAFPFMIFMAPPSAVELTWRREDLGLSEGPERIPVYLQKHALEQLARRIPGMTNVLIACTLLQAKFVRQSQDSFLVEVRCGAYKLGYFAGRIVGDKILLTTFLFLTMQGTPESDLLYHKLRLTRRDIEFLHLDELSLFGSREIRADRQLSQILQECGCGHLLEIHESVFAQHHHHDGDADMLRKYLGGFLHQNKFAAAKSG